jgi:glycosyl transferase family 25
MSTNIDAILYINLEHRTDRNIHILNELHKICTDDSKIHRIDAIKNDNGALGCGLSHIKALEYALKHSINNDWKTILIVEDDFTFKYDSNEIERNINLLFEHNFDVGLLSHGRLKYHNSNNEIKKVIYSQTTSSYIIKRDYIYTLLENITYSVNDMISRGLLHENHIDIHWTKLQPIHNWYAVFPAIGCQYDNYSDIEKKYVAYT